MTIKLTNNFIKNWTFILKKNLLHFYLAKNFLILSNFYWINFFLKKNIINIFFLKKNILHFNVSIINITFLNNFFNFFFKKIFFILLNFNKQKFLICQLDLKGINYWLYHRKQSILLDIGFSHFYLYKYSKNLYLWLKKKWMKRLTFISFYINLYSSIIKFFRFVLRPVGPYKLKGFHFFNENIFLKEGKKPFK